MRGPGNVLPLLAGTIVTALLLAACGGDSAAPRSTPTPFFTPGTGAGPSAAQTPPGSTPPVTTPPLTTPPVTTPPAGTPPPSEGNRGTVTVGASRYAFTVRTCTSINGQYYFVGDGDASIALASVLVIQTVGRGSFMVDDPAVSVRGGTLTVSGAARSLVLPGDRAEVTLTAPCPGLAN